jgi:hypothetical protein
MNVQEFGLGPQLDTRKVPDNWWPSVFEEDAKKIIAMLSKEKQVKFFMTESHDIQALANGNPAVIIVSGGLADAICRFCAKLIGAGTFVSFGSANEPDWKPTIAQSIKPIQDLIRDEPFRWLPAYIPWIEDDERLQIFGFLSITIHRFVVLHELGHIVFRHSERAGGVVQPVVDGKAQDLPDRSSAITSQAREIAADTYALNKLCRLFEAEYESPNLDPMRQLLKAKLMGTPRERLRMAMFAAFSVFQILDRRNWSLDQAMRASHPPAPARVKAVYATVLEMKLPGLTEDDLMQDIEIAHELSHAIISVSFDTFPNIYWLKQLENPDFNQFMIKVVEAVPQHMRSDKQPSPQPIA